MGQRSEVKTQDLFEYGIYTEVSDIRAHVSVANRLIYVFPTRNGIRAIENFKPPIKPAYQKGVNGKTAEGWLVKVEWIDDLRRLRFDSWTWEEYRTDMDTSEKGRWAVNCVLAAMRLGRFPFWVDAQESDRDNVQKQGTDILVFCRKRVQVKCDAKSGDLPLGTGNIFLQRAEKNPLKKC